MRALVSLAYLKVLWDKEKKNILDLYIPFLVEVFIKKNITEFSEDEIGKIKEFLQEEFGLRIPHHPVVSLLNRAKKRGILEKKEHKYHVIESKLTKFRGKFVDAERSIQELIAKIENYTKRNFPTQQITREEIQKTLIDFLAQFEYQLVLDPTSIDLPKLSKKGKRELFILGNAIQAFYREDHHAWELFQSLVIGNILSKLLLYDQNLLKAKYKGLNIYLDTKIIFRLMGVEGEELKNAYQNFIDELKKHGAKIWVFQHTYDEMMVILEGCYQWIDNPGYDPSKASLVLRYFKEKGYHQSDVELFKAKIMEKMEKMGVRIADSPSIDPRYQIDETKLKNVIIEVYQANPRFEPLEKEYTIERDIRSISSIYQLRRDNKPFNLRRAKHIFITSNIGLAYAVTKFHKEEYSNDQFSIPPCVTDTFLGTVTWLNDPEKVEKITPMSILSLSIGAAMPSRDFIEKWQQEIRKLYEKGNITEDDYILLRDSQLARELLDEKTLGDPELITSKTAMEILEEIKHEAMRKYKEEKERHEKTMEELKSLKEKERKRKKELKRRASRYASSMTWIFTIAMMSLFALSLLLKWSLLIKIFSFIFTLFGILGITVSKIKLLLTEYIKRILGGA